jgi:hypothetical protein
VRLRFALLAVVLATVLTACGGGSGSTSPRGSDPATRLGPTPTASLTPVTVPCKRYAGIAQEIATAETKLYSAGSGADDALSSLVAELQKLKDGAPADVRSALDDLSSAFATARSELAAPTQAGTAKLKALATRLSADGQKITAYIVSTCG